MTQLAPDFLDEYILLGGGGGSKSFFFSKFNEGKLIPNILWVLKPKIKLIVLIFSLCFDPRWVQNHDFRPKSQLVIKMKKS